METGYYPTNSEYYGKNLTDEYVEWLEINYKYSKILQEAYYNETKEKPTFFAANAKGIGYTKDYKIWVEQKRCEDTNLNF